MDGWNVMGLCKFMVNRAFLIIQWWINKLLLYIYIYIYTHTTKCCGRLVSCTCNSSLPNLWHLIWWGGRVVSPSLGSCTCSERSPLSLEKKKLGAPWKQTVKEKVILQADIFLSQADTSFILHTNYRTSQGKTYISTQLNSSYWLQLYF
jgi:hypothetical protein